MNDAARRQTGMIDMESNTTLVQCYPAHEAVPAGQGPFPPVIVVHDRFGLNAHVKGIANRLANAGFYALAPAFYAMPTSVADVAPDFMRPAGPVHFDYGDETSADEQAGLLSDERAETILQQAIDYTAFRSASRAGPCGVLGFSMGARLAFLAACRNPADVSACVGFYGRGIASPTATQRGGPLPIDLAPDLSASVLFFYGQLDTTISRTERALVRQRLAALGKDFRIEVFPDAGEEFFCEERDTHRIHASKVAWEETLALFSRCL
ncbi:MAG TPA: dienelactone hydrolase family protein [Thermoanaerobaculia bacterium]|nr:dienelactone hydrolase family protein [Thermoanaerobaculia bacterium]